MAELLFNYHSYLEELDAAVTGMADAGVALDCPVFYIGEGGLLVHLIDRDRHETGSRVSGPIDRECRYPLMRMHTDRHILCAVIWQDYGSLARGGIIQPDGCTRVKTLPKWASSTTNASESTWKIEYVQDNSRNSARHGIFDCRVFRNRTQGGSLPKCA